MGTNRLICEKGESDWRPCRAKRGKLAVNLTMLNSTFYWHFNIPAFYLLEQILGKCVILTYYMCGILINTVQINNTYYICFLLIIFAFLKISNKFCLMERSEISLFTKLLAKPTRHYVVPIWVFILSITNPLLVWFWNLCNVIFHFILTSKRMSKNLSVILKRLPHQILYA